jgi:site-specific DNA-cytosine methylase
MIHPHSPSVVTFKHFHFCMGLGGFAKGMNRSTAKVGNFKGVMRCIGGVDSDPASVADFTRLAGVPGTLLDLFSPEQYEGFHGHTPPAGWRQATADDIRRAAGGEIPDVVCISAPCKGLSGLLSEEKSKTTKYQALNKLTERCVFLMMEAWSDNPPSIIVFENVPRIASRGRAMLDRIRAILHHYGYAVAETVHDCGVVGGLAQSRKRFLMVARHMAKVPPFLYEPDEKPLRAVGQVLQDFPLPGDESAGPMHRIPRLQWKTWVRLAMVEAGKDWRSLNRLRVVDGMLADYAIMPDMPWRDGTLGVLPWSSPAGVVTANAEATTGRYSVADPRPEVQRRAGALGVMGWDETAGTVAGESLPPNGNFAVADPREVGRRGDYLGVANWEEPIGTVTSTARPSNGAYSVADPRVDGHEKSVQLGVRRWDQTAPVVTGKMFAGGGPHSVADPRVDIKPNGHNSLYRVVPFDSAARTGASHVAGGAPSIADPRHHGPAKHNNCFRVVRFDQPSAAVTAGTGPTAGGLAVADPRRPDSRERGKYHVAEFDQPARTVIAASTTGDGAFAVADPRTGWNEGAHQSKLRVTPFDQPVGAITGSSASGHGFTSGAMAVADPRPVSFGDGREAYQTGGHYGVVPWSEPAVAVTGSGQHDNGRWSVADPRQACGDPMVRLPAPDDRLVAVIRSLDNTWHRPFTTLELAALQSLVKPGELFELDGISDSAKRERIGNAVPPDSAMEVGNVILTTMLLALTGETFLLSNTPIWVRNVAVGLAIDTSPNNLVLDMDA